MTMYTPVYTLYSVLYIFTVNNYIVAIIIRGLIKCFVNFVTGFQLQAMIRTMKT